VARPCDKPFSLLGAAPLTRFSPTTSYFPPAGYPASRYFLRTPLSANLPLLNNPPSFPLLSTVTHTIVLSYREQLPFRPFPHSNEYSILLFDFPRRPVTRPLLLTTQLFPRHALTFTFPPLLFPKERARRFKGIFFFFLLLDLPLAAPLSAGLSFRVPVYIPFPPAKVCKIRQFALHSFLPLESSARAGV